jgi:hypothetical protein
VIFIYICLGIITLCVICWTWAMLMSEDQGESKLERLVSAAEEYVDARKETNRIADKRLR